MRNQDNLFELHSWLPPTLLQAVSGMHRFRGRHGTMLVGADGIGASSQTRTWPRRSGKGWRNRRRAAQQTPTDYRSTLASTRRLTTSEIASTPARASCAAGSFE